VSAKPTRTSISRSWGFKVVFYSETESWLKKLQEQASFEGAIFQTLICSAKF
jgi:hypothetical protein